MQTALKPPAANSLDGLSVVVVEDDYFVASELASMLTKHGARVIGPVPDVARARELLSGEKPDCLLLDVNLRGEFVYEMAGEMLTQGYPVIFTTGYDATVLPATLSDVPCLMKPVDSQALLLAIQQQLADRAPAR